jgi:hypothetical protein
VPRGCAPSRMHVGVQTPDKTKATTPFDACTARHSLARTSPPGRLQPYAAANVLARCEPALTQRASQSASHRPSKLSPHRANLPSLTAISFDCVAFARPLTTVPLAITSPFQARVKSSVGAPSSVNDDQGLRIVPRETSRPMDELTPPARMEG